MSYLLTDEVVIRCAIFSSPSLDSDTNRLIFYEWIKVNCVNLIPGRFPSEGNLTRLSYSKPNWKGHFVSDVSENLPWGKLGIQESSRGFRLVCLFVCCSYQCNWIQMNYVSSWLCASWTGDPIFQMGNFCGTFTNFLLLIGLLFECLGWEWHFFLRADFIPS